MYECKVRGTILGLGRYVSRLTIRIHPPPYNISGVWWELPPPPFLFTLTVDLLKPSSEQLLVSTLNGSHMDL
jgi:hypothetical protein